MITVDEANMIGAEACRKAISENGMDIPNTPWFFVYGDPGHGRTQFCLLGRSENVDPLAGLAGIEDLEEYVSCYVDRIDGTAAINEIHRRKS